MDSFVGAIVRAKVAKICDHVGYHAITKDSTAILVDLYGKILINLGMRCKEFAERNRRIEPTLTDLIQAFDYAGIDIPELKEHAENVKIPFDIKIEREEPRPSNRIQRNLFVDDQLDHEKNSELDDNEDNNGTSNEDEEDKNMTPFLKDIYPQITNQHPSQPVKASKARIKREEKNIIPKLKITPLDPSIAEPPSFLPIIKKENYESSGPSLNSRLKGPANPDKPGRGRRKGTKNKVQKTKLKANTKPKATKGLKRGRKPKAAKLAAAATVKLTVSPEPREPSPVPSPPSPIIPSPPPQPIASTSAKSPSPPPAPPVKQTKKEKKKKKRSSNQFSIVTETVAADDKEWLCPTCHRPDNGGLMVGCDTCELWYHLACTSLKREPKEEEKWSCIRCTESRSGTPPPPPTDPVISTSRSGSCKKEKSKKGRKRSRTPVEVPVITKTPELQPAEPRVTLSPVKLEPQVATRPPETGSSQDDLCPECQLPDDGTLMIQCDDPFCARWFHGKCVKVLEEPKDDESWFCKVCVEKQASAFKRRRRI